MLKWSGDKLGVVAVEREVLANGALELKVGCCGAPGERGRALSETTLGASSAYPDTSEGSAISGASAAGSRSASGAVSDSSAAMSTADASAARAAGSVADFSAVVPSVSTMSSAHGLVASERVSIAYGLRKQLEVALEAKCEEAKLENSRDFQVATRSKPASNEGALKVAKTLSELSSRQSKPRPSGNSEHTQIASFSGGRPASLEAPSTAEFVVSSAGLTSSVASDIIRGVPLHRCLEWFCYLFSTSTGSLETCDNDYGLSHNVPRISDFISHDWQTPRWQKFVALCMVYNHHAAMLASAMAFILILVSRLAMGQDVVFGASEDLTFELAGAMYTLRIGIGYTLVSLIVMLVFLCYWQQLRRFLVGNRPVFLDKVCVHQTNSELKKAAILGLAAFIKKSNNLVILWTPRTFTRLWCTYEITSWMHFQKPIKKVNMCLVPQKLFMLFLFCICLISVAQQLLFLRMAMQFAFTHFHHYIISSLTLSWMFAIYMPFALDHMRGWSKVNAQIRQFSVQEASCRCCSVDHCDPVTGEELKCDRVLISEALRRWHDEEEESPCRKVSSADSLRSMRPAHIDYFDLKVQNGLRDLLNQDFRYDLLRFSDVMITGLPLMLLCLESIAAAFAGLPSLDLKLRFTLTNLTYVLCMFPLTIQAVERCLKPLSKRQPGARRTALIILVLVLLPALHNLSVVGLRWAMAQKSMVMQVVISSVSFWITLLLYGAKPELKQNR